MNSWKSVSKTGLFTGVILALVFWIYALTDEDGFLFLDYVNLPFHEFGHVFFSFLGENISIWGGTIMQLAIPFGILAYFFFYRETAGFAFSSFWFGENFLNISVYIADARKMQLPLVGGGEHDWNTILTSMHMLRYDTLIAGIVKTLGWIIMISSIVWFIILAVKSDGSENEQIF
ncbi:MAG: hypothetical protein LLF28_06535 [Nitrospiraceae bacterium]|nr:hypothetical protein [Nitrospiraceae bacterium]